MVFSLAGAGLLAGSSLLSANAARSAQERDRRRHRRMIRRRRSSPEGQALQGAVGRLQSLSETLPGQIRSGLRSQAQSRAQANLANLNRSLAQRGFTAGSDVFGRAQRGQIGQTISDLSNVETQAGQFESSLLGNLANVSQRAGQFFNPLAPGPEEAFIDPGQIIGQGLLGGILGGRLDFGGGDAFQSARFPSGSTDIGFDPRTGLNVGL